MAILKIAQIGHPVLREIAEPVPVDEITSPEFQGFIEGNLIGRVCRVQVGTVNKKNPGKAQYSKVEKVLRFAKPVEKPEEVAK